MDILKHTNPLIRVLAFSTLTVFALEPVVFSQTASERGSPAANVRTAPEAPSAFARPRRVQKPIPRQLKISIGAAILVIGGVALVFATRAWRSSNLFGREYRFPSPAKAALRLGTRRSGGQMATISFRERAGLEADSGTENL